MRFEFAQRARRLSSLIYFALFFAMSFLAMIAAGGAFKSIAVSVGSGGKVFVNGPQALLGLVSIFGSLGMLVTASVFGQAVCQDWETRAHPLFFTMPIRERSYLLGRFAGAFVFLVGVYVSIACGLWIGAHMPFVEGSLRGPEHLSYYLWPYVVSTLPNLVIFGAIFFSVAALTRKMMPVYVCSVVLLMGYLIAGSLLSKVESRTFAALVDPFGGSAIEVATRYFSVAEKNTRLVSLRGIVLQNRLLWLFIAVLVLGYAIARFRFAAPKEASRQKRETLSTPPTVATSGTLDLRLVPLRLVWSLTWLSFTETVKPVYFRVIVLAAVLFTAVTLRESNAFYGTNTYPVTYFVLEIVGGTFSMFMLLVATLYSGELVWRERDAHADQLFDTLPVPTWLPFVCKLLALFLVQATLMVAVMLCGIFYQASQGYFHFEVGLYLKELFVLRLVSFWMVCTLAMFVQSLVQQKSFGHFVMVLYYVLFAFLGKLGIEHHLFTYANAPDYTYSDMNGYGPFLRPVRWFYVYWASLAMLLALLSTLLWQRGTAAPLRARLALARAPDAQCACGDRRVSRDLRSDGRGHLLQHQHPQCLSQLARPGARASRLRAPLQAARRQAPTSHRRGEARCRSLPIDAFPARQRHAAAREYDGRADHDRLREPTHRGRHPCADRGGHRTCP